MNRRGEPTWRLDRRADGEIYLTKRGNNIGEPVAVFSKGEEAVAERVLAMLNTFSAYDRPGSPTYGPYRETFSPDLPPGKGATHRPRAEGPRLPNYPNGPSRFSVGSKRG